MKPLNILDRVIRSGFLFKIIGLDTVLRMNSKEEKVERLGDQLEGCLSNPTDSRLHQKDCSKAAEKSRFWIYFDLKTSKIY